MQRNLLIAGLVILALIVLGLITLLNNQREALRIQLINRYERAY